MEILIGVLVVAGLLALLALGWWLMSGSSFGSHRTDEQKRRGAAAAEWDEKHRWD